MVNNIKSAFIKDSEFSIKKHNGLCVNIVSEEIDVEISNISEEINYIRFKVNYLLNESLKKNKSILMSKEEYQKCFPFIDSFLKEFNLIEKALKMKEDYYTERYDKKKKSYIDRMYYDTDGGLNVLIVIPSSKTELDIFYLNSSYIKGDFAFKVKKGDNSSFISSHDLNKEERAKYKGLAKKYINQFDLIKKDNEVHDISNALFEVSFKEYFTKPYFLEKISFFKINNDEIGLNEFMDIVDSKMNRLNLIRKQFDYYCKISKENASILLKEYEYELTNELIEYFSNKKNIFEDINTIAYL